MFIKFIATRPNDIDLGSLATTQPTCITRQCSSHNSYPNAIYTNPDKNPPKHFLQEHTHKHTHTHSRTDATLHNRTHPHAEKKTKKSAHTNIYTRIRTHTPSTPIDEFKCRILSYWPKFLIQIFYAPVLPKKKVTVTKKLKLISLTEMHWFVLERTHTTAVSYLDDIALCVCSCL